MTSSPTGASSLCTFVLWQDYDWYNIVQCNPSHYGLKIHWNPAVYCLIAAGHAITIWICLELLVDTFKRFKRWKTLFPWAILFAILGLIGLTISCDLSIWVLPPMNHGYVALNLISGIVWLTASPIVLYSRLKLIMPASHTRIRYAILALIIVDSIAFQVPSVAVTIIAFCYSMDEAHRLSVRSSYVDIGMAGQDIVLSAIFVYYFWRHTRDRMVDLPPKAQQKLKMTFHMVLAFAALIAAALVLQLTLLGKRLFLARWIIYPVIRVFVLRYEFFVLNKIVRASEVRISALQEGNFMEILGRENAVCDRDSLTVAGTEQSINSCFSMKAAHEGRHGGARASSLDDIDIVE